MKNIVKKKPETIPVGTGRDDAKVLLIIFGPTKTVVRVMVAARFKNRTGAKARAEEIRNQEVLCLRKVGYEQTGRRKWSIRIINWKVFIAVDYVFQWSDWKWGIMKMAKPS